MIRKFGQLVTKNYQRTLTNFLSADKDMTRRDQSTGTNNMDAMLLNCVGGSHQSKDTRNCRIYVNFIVMITFSIYRICYRLQFFFCFYLH